MSQPTKECVQRLQRELRELSRSPPDAILSSPHPDNILEWHYVLLGPADTPYDGGVYHGKLTFPPTYPHAPPAIYMFTPSGRFETNKKLCLSLSDYHPETWSPAWSVSSVLVGLLSFMCEDAVTAGSITTTEAEKLRYAEKSIEFNMRNPTFCKLFPMLCDDSDDDEGESDEEEADGDGDE